LPDALPISRYQAPPHHARLLQLLQPRRQHVGRDLRQPALQLREPPWPDQQVPHDQQGPALADDLELAGNAAILSVAPVPHARNLSLPRFAVQSMIAIMKQDAAERSSITLDPSHGPRRP